MGYDTYGPTQRPRPARPVTVPSTIGALEQRQRQDDRKLPGKDRVTGTPVHGSSNAEQFILTAPDSDGYVVTLPGASTLAWQVTVGARAVGDATATLTVSVNSTTYPSITLSSGYRGTPPAVLIGYGGDDFTCEAVVTGTGSATVDLEFTAIRLS